MAIFLTGSTGYIGAHVAVPSAGAPRRSLNLLVRAKTEQEAERAPVARAATASGLSAVPGCPRHAHFHFSRRSHRSAIRAGRGRLRAPGRHDRFGDSLRRFAQSQIRKKLPQRESARHAGSGATGAPRAGRPRLAALQPGLHRRRGGPSQPRNRYRGRFHRLEPLRLRSLRAHQEILRAHGARTASGCSANRVSPQHRAG